MVPYFEVLRLYNQLSFRQKENIVLKRGGRAVELCSLFLISLVHKISLAFSLKTFFLKKFVLALGDVHCIKVQ